MKGKCLKIIVVIYVVFVLVVVLYVVILKYNEFVGVICEENWFDGYSFDKVYIVVFFVL